MTAPVAVGIDPGKSKKKRREIIEISRGMVATVDAVDYERLSRYKWSAVPSKNRTTFYAVRMGSSKSRRSIWMHREVLGATEGARVDHIDGDGLNNARENLRACSVQQNQMNRHRKASGSSRYKGVRWWPRSGKWRAQITVDGRGSHLGTFASEREAAVAYDDAARGRFGAFGRYNFPRDGEQSACRTK